jgi:isoleucyl-tRNA synthetase
MVEAYRKIRNTARFILGNLSDFVPERDSVPLGEMPELDRWALHQLNRLIERVDDAYGRYSFHTIYHTLYNFCTVELSARYLDILKDRLYVLKADAPGRRASQTVLFRIITSLTRLMAPILSITAEELWGVIPGEKRTASVFLSDFPVADKAACDDELAARWEEIFTVRGEVSRALEEARRSKVVGLSLEAAVDLYLSEKWLERIAPYEEQLPEILIVSAVTLHPLEEAPEDAQPEGEVSGVRVQVRPAEGEKCGRCWNFSLTVGEDTDHPEICSRCSGVLRELRM